MQNAPDFSQGLDSSTFQVQGTDNYTKQLGDASKGIASLGYDWTNVNSLIDQEGALQGQADAQVKDNTSAGREAQLSQDDLSASNDPASIGKALMALGSKMSSQQAVQAGRAQEQQTLGQAGNAQALHQEMAQQRLAMYSKELDMQNTKFGMQNAVQQMSNGLALANQQLRNMYNQAVSSAKNAQQLADVRVQHDNFAQIMNYVGMGLGAASSVAAGGASALGPSASDMSLAQTYDAGSKAMVTSGYNPVNPGASSYGPPSSLSDFYGVQYPSTTLPASLPTG